ncbi:MFS transporter [Streptomyces sp. ME02-7008A-1]|uniref:MFS transporter n=1 Tax=unclassified Streptomyces TaxID=2593676 RepID=UPI0029AD8F87|nr:MULTISPECIES: MFS transporter [unclassified Streptomyces]MDX3179663.1 MFS transporter [Streptomyces sp. ME02-7008A-1]MDX3300404.1 MFS transporter [Streptomyces sp. ME02-7008A]
MSDPRTSPDPTPLVAAGEPSAPGTSTKLAEGKPFKRYLLFYALGLMGFFMTWGAVNGILLPNHVQAIEFDKFFTGADSGVDLQQLNDLKAQVDDGAVIPTGEQERLLGVLEKFESARAQGLSVITAIGLFVSMFIQPITGVLSDRMRSPWGRRAPWIAAGAVLGGLALIGLRQSSTILLVAVCWGFGQLVINVGQGPLLTTVADRVDESKIGTASAISGLGSMFGGVAGALVGGVLFTQFGLDAYYPFVLMLLFCALVFVYFARDRSSMALQVEPINWRGFFQAFVTPLRDSDFRWVWIAKIAMMFGYAVSHAFSIYMLQSYVQPSLSLTEATKTAPLLQLAGLPCMLVTMVLVGRWSDRMGRRKPFVFWASILMAASMLVPLVWATVPGLFVQAVIGGIALGAFVVVDQALFIDVIPDKKTAGRDLGMANLAGNFGQAIGPVAAGQVVAITAGYSMVWVVSLVVVVVAAFAILPVKRAK